MMLRVRPVYRFVYFYKPYDAADALGDAQMMTLRLRATLLLGLTLQLVIEMTADRPGRQGVASS